MFWCTIAQLGGRKLDPGLSPCTNISSKWIKDFNVRHETELLRERSGETVEHIGNNFQSRIIIVQQLRERVDK
jgi:hypothetical protein